MDVTFTGYQLEDSGVRLTFTGPVGTTRTIRVTNDELTAMKDRKAFLALVTERLRAKVAAVSAASRLDALIGEKVVV